MTTGFDPRHLCSRARLFSPVGQKAAAELWARFSGNGKECVLENASLLPVENAHFLLLPDEKMETLLAFMRAWYRAKMARSLAFWSPRVNAGVLTDHLVVWLNGMRVPMEADLVHAQLEAFFRRPPTWAETMATYRFYSGRQADPAVLESEFLQQFFRHCKGPEKARDQFFRAQLSCLDVLLSNHHDALVEKNLNVVAPVQRRTNAGTVQPTILWAQIALALKKDVVAVSMTTAENVVFTVHPPFSGLDSPESLAGMVPDWVRMAFHEYRNLAEG